MKKILTMMLIVTSLVCLSSCSSEEEVYIPQEVDLTLSYSFAESGSMTKATGAEVYNDFYEKYIKTKKLAPTTYSLTFKHKTTGATTTITNGIWKNKDAIRLIEGEYEVTGTSAPIPKDADILSHYVSDTVFISFEEVISVTKDMKNLNLTAKYDSFLLMFDDVNYSDIHYHYYESGRNYNQDLYKTENNYVIFINGFPSIGANYNSVWLLRNDASKIKIELEKLPFEKGKYYYFNDMTNSFDIPPMESGN